MENNNVIEIVARCKTCKNIKKLHVNKDDYRDFTVKGIKAQDAFPYLSPDEREILISKTCSTCWDKIFGEG